MCLSPRYIHKISQWLKKAQAISQASHHSCLAYALTLVDRSKGGRGIGLWAKSKNTGHSWSNFRPKRNLCSYRCLSKCQTNVFILCLFCMCKTHRQPQLQPQALSHIELFKLRQAKSHFCIAVTCVPNHAVGNLNIELCAVQLKCVEKVLILRKWADP